MDAGTPAEARGVYVAGVASVEGDRASDQSELTEVRAWPRPGQVDGPGPVVKAEDVCEPAHWVPSGRNSQSSRA